MRLDQIIKRAEKLIKAKSDRKNMPSVMSTETGIYPENFRGLVVILNLPPENLP